MHPFYIYAMMFLIFGAFIAFSRFVIVPLGEPSSVWLWCDMLSTCSTK